MTRKSLIVTTVVAVALLLAGCPFGPELEITDILKVLVNSEALPGLVYDFGPVHPDLGPVEVTVVVTNASEQPVTLTSATLEPGAGSSGLFTLGTPELPFTLEPEATESFSLAFDPVESGARSAVIAFVLEGIPDALELVVEGQGNYPPTAWAAVIVSGAGTAAVNGTYRKTGTHNTVGYDVQTWDELAVPYAIPLYTLGDTVYRIWGESVEGIWWYIDDDLDSAYSEPPDSVLYAYEYGPGYIAPSNSGGGWDWATDAGSGDPPTVVGELGSFGGSELVPGIELTANYVFEDPDGDPEGITRFQWQRASDAPNGTFVDIADATAGSYEVQGADLDFYIRVLVTPVASSGLAEGEPVALGPSIRAGSVPQ